MAGVGSKPTLFSKILSINSNDRISGGGGNRSSNFVVQLSTNLQECLSVSYKSCRFQNNIYNVRGITPNNNSFNNVVYFTTGSGANGGSTIPPGWYNASSLMQAVINAINVWEPSFDDVFSYTISPTSGLITLTYVSSGAGGPFLQNTDQTAGPSSTYFGPWELLGFTAPFSIQPTQSVTAATLPSLGGIPVVYLRSQALAPSNAFLTGGQVANTFQSINMTAPFMGVQSDECKVDELCQVNFDRARLVNQVDFQVTDHDGNEINLNGATVCVEMRVKFNKY
jgi:hypothetical protein